MTNSESKMKTEDHTKWVGAIVTNLQALETVLRYFLLTANGQAAEFPKLGAKDTVINFLTDYRSLGNLMMLYNEKLTEKKRNMLSILNLFLQYETRLLMVVWLQRQNFQPLCGNSANRRIPASRSNFRKS